MWYFIKQTMNPIDFIPIMTEETFDYSKNFQIVTIFRYADISGMLSTTFVVFRF